MIVKHANPCGVAYGGSLLEAYDRAYQTDPESAFGGIIAFNRALDADTARAIIERQFVEVIIAPEIGDDALAGAGRQEERARTGLRRLAADRRAAARFQARHRWSAGAGGRPGSCSIR